MIKDVFRFLRGANISDTRTVDSLFVTAYLFMNHISTRPGTFLSSFIIREDNTELSKVVHLLGDISTFSLEVLIQLFEFVISPADRIVTGAVYTPKRIRERIVTDCLGNKTVKELLGGRVADISCGCGGFLMDAAQLIHRKTGKRYDAIFKENIYGVDIKAYAIERTKILLSLLALTEGEGGDFEFNLLCRDTLDFKDEGWNEQYRDFDVIVGNPPYVCSRNLTDETRAKLKGYVVCDSGNPDLYIPFFQIAVEMLSDNGIMGYITMNTFLRSVNGRSLRQYFSDLGYAITILDFRGFQVFESKSAYTCLFFLDKSTKTDSIRYTVDEKGELSSDIDYSAIRYVVLDNLKGWTLNDFETTVAVESTGIQIKDYCTSRHGIATLSNDTYIFRPLGEDETCYYLREGDLQFQIEKTICRDIINPNRFHEGCEFAGLVEKVIFPYCVADDRAVIIPPVVMQRDYPFTWDYFCHKKNILLARDKGKTENYPQWYAYGRTQSLILPRFKLFFPKFANRPLNCVICDDQALLLYNGLAFVCDDVRRLLVLKAVIESELFWNYIRSNGKPYASGYYSLSGVDIKHFSIPQLTHEEEETLITLENKKEREAWLKRKYFGLQNRQ